MVELLVVVCGTDVAGGVEDPNRDGIETDDNEEVDDTGEGIVETFVGGGKPFVVTEAVVVAPALGPNKFEILCGCFIEIGCCGDIDCCFELGEVDVVDVVVQVEGILAAVDTGLIPFCVAVDG